MSQTWRVMEWKGGPVPLTCFLYTRKMPVSVNQTAGARSLELHIQQGVQILAVVAVILVFHLSSRRRESA